MNKFEDCSSSKLKSRKHNPAGFPVPRVQLPKEQLLKNLPVGLHQSPVIGQRKTQYWVDLLRL